jgi:hypothetical protein
MNLTGVISSTAGARRVHLGWDEGANTLPLCGRLANRETETTDSGATCRDCIVEGEATGQDLQGLVWLSDARTRLVAQVREHARADRSGGDWQLVADQMSDYEISMAIGRARSLKGAVAAVGRTLED